MSRALAGHVAVLGRRLDALAQRIRALPPGPERTDVEFVYDQVLSSFGKLGGLLGTTGGSYRRDVLVAVLIYHQATEDSGCHCGWAVVGASHAGHVADVYEASVAAGEGG